MGTRTGKPRWALLALAFLVCAGGAAPLPARDDDALRKKALQLNQLTGADPIKGKVRALTEDAANTRKLLAVAARMAKDKKQPFNVNATLVLASVAENLKDVEAAETFYRLHAEQSLKLLSLQGVAQSYVGLIQLFYANKQYAKCEQACREFLGLEGEDTVERLKAGVLRRLILAMAKQGKFQKASEITEKIIKAQPDNWLNLEIKGQLLREVGKLDESIKVYQDIIERIRKDKRLEKKDQEALVKDFRYGLSGLYLDHNQVDKAAAELKSLLDKEPDNPTYLNDLGYIWADHDQKLAESEKMIRKAIEEDRKQRLKADPDLRPEQVKENAAYLDSLGWVLFKQKKYPEAKKYLRQAVADKEGRHVEIYDHLGDVHLALGEKAEAVAAWKKALEVAGPSKREQDRKAAVEKKIKANSAKE